MGERCVMCEGGECRGWVNRVGTRVAGGGMESKSLFRHDISFRVIQYLVK